MDGPVRKTVSGEETSGKLSLRLLETVAQVRGVPTDDLDLCLHDYVDVDALETLFEPSPAAAAARRGSVTFPVDEVCLTVTVGAEGSVEIRGESRGVDSNASSGCGCS